MSVTVGSSQLASLLSRLDIGVETEQKVDSQSEADGATGSFQRIDKPAASSASLSSSVPAPAALLPTTARASASTVPLPAPLYSPPPSTALPSSSPFLPSAIVAPPGSTITVEGTDNRRHTYNEYGEELGNDPLTGCYEEVELEDMDWEAEQRRFTYPCPCGDRFSISIEEMQDGEVIARCPSCSLLIRVIYEPDDIFEKEEDEDR